MSIKDYTKNYIVINGTTNEQIPIPKSVVNSTVLKDYTLNDIALFSVVLEELRDCDCVTIMKTYMK